MVKFKNLGLSLTVIKKSRKMHFVSVNEIKFLLPTPLLPIFGMPVNLTTGTCCGILMMLQVTEAVVMNH